MSGILFPQKSSNILPEFQRNWLKSLWNSGGISLEFGQDLTGIPVESKKFRHIYFYCHNSIDISLEFL